MHATTKPSDRSELAHITRLIENSCEQGRYAECLELILEHPLEAWFGLNPQQFVRTLRRVIAAGADPDGVGAAFVHFVSMASELAAGVGAADGQSPLQALPDTFRNLGQMFHLRMRGLTLEALKVAAELKPAVHTLATVYDASGGLQQFTNLHCGITAMLAGEFEEALAALTAAQLSPMIPTLSFLTRDAYVKAALLHAAFGDFAIAEGLLAKAEDVPRSTSWAEPVIDANVALATAILSIHDIDHARDLVDAVPLQEVGEMWPFYVIAYQRVLERQSLRGELLKRLEGFEQIPWPRVSGEGFTGSVLPLARATSSLAAGDITQARSLIQAADPNFVATKLSQMLVDVLAGSTKRLLETSAEIRERTQGLRQLDLLRVSMVVGAHFLRDEVDDAAVLLTALAEAPGGIKPYEVLYFSVPVREFAEERIPAWPRASGQQSIFVSELPVLRVFLSERELEILKELARGGTREEIAAELFVSANTVKTHIASIYRKLGVRTRREALADAQLRGIL